MSESEKRKIIEEINPSEAQIKKIHWYVGDPYSPPGYYALIEFRGETMQVLLQVDGERPSKNI